jgi:hypothetical protein
VQASQPHALLLEIFTAEGIGTELRLDTTDELGDLGTRA